MGEMMDAATPGSGICGKTGTAETPTGEDHSWWIGFAPCGNPRYAIAVIVENAGFGSDAARPAAFQVFRARNRLNIIQADERAIANRGPVKDVVERPVWLLSGESNPSSGDCPSALH